MAELLVYRKNHWMDNLTAEEITQRAASNPNFMNSYEARYQQGDIVEIRENGYWSTRGFNKTAFVVIKVPDLTYSPDHMAALYDGENIRHRRRFRIRKEDLPVAVRQQLAETGEYTTTRATLLNYYTDKGAL